MADRSFKKLLENPPHKDISKLNRFFVESGLTASVDDVVRFANRLGYIFAAEHAREHRFLLKKQLNQAEKQLGDDFDLNFFCDVAGTGFFNDFMEFHGVDDFYQKAINFIPDININGEFSSLKKKALIAVRHQKFSKIYTGIDYVERALHTSLKRIGVNPNDEILGLSKSLTLTMLLMDEIGGIQFYLPKAFELQKIISDVDMYIDSFSMDARTAALKYGVSYKTVHTVAKRISSAMKEYEEGK